MKFKDLTGMKFGRLTVLRLDEKQSTPSGKYWVCKCDCGNIKTVSGDSLKKPEGAKGSCKSCGCLKRELIKERHTKDLTGQRFGRLVVIKQVEKPEGRKQKGVYWLCQCDCGNTCIVKGRQLISGNTRSCGCLGYENMLEQGKKLGKWNIEHKGELHPTYNPNLTDEQRKENETRHMDACRKRTRRRDNYTCQCCGHYSKKGLICHHKNSWDKFPEQRHDDDNLVTLCDKCHKEFHGIYGYGNNTEEQYNEFINNKNNKDNTEVTQETKAS